MPKWPQSICSCFAGADSKRRKASRLRLRSCVSFGDNSANGDPAVKPFLLEPLENHRGFHVGKLFEKRIDQIS